MPYLYKLIYIIIIQFSQYVPSTFNAFTFDVMQDNSSAKFHYVWPNLNNATPARIIIVAGQCNMWKLDKPWSPANW